MMTAPIWLVSVLAVVVIALSAALVYVLLRRQKSVEDVCMELENVVRAVSEWQQVSARQVDVQALQSQLTQQISQTSNAIAQVQSQMNNLEQFTRQTLFETARSQLQDALDRLGNLQTALKDVINELSHQRAESGTHHTRMQEHFQEVGEVAAQFQEALREIRRTQTDDVTPQLRRALEQLGKLQQALDDLRAFADGEAREGEERHRAIQDALREAIGVLGSVQQNVSDASGSLQQGQENIRKLLSDIQRTLNSVQTMLSRIDEQAQRMPMIEQSLARLEDGIGQLTSVLLGRRGGMVGERVVDELLSVFPEGWVQHNLQLGTGTVEFAVTLPNGYFVPLDSKVVGAEVLAQLEGDVNGDGLRELEQKLERYTQNRAREIAERYLCDERTIGIGIMAVPDALYSLCRRAIKGAAERHSIVVVPYSLLVPFVLSLYLLAQRLGVTQISETEKMLANLYELLDKARHSLEGQARALKQLQNRYNELTSAIYNALTIVRPATGEEVALPELEASAELHKVDTDE